MNFYSEEKESVLKHLNSSPDGLNESEVKQRQEEHGLNELPKKKQESILKLFISQFQNPIELILVFTVVLLYTAQLLSNIKLLANGNVFVFNESLISPSPSQ